MTERQGVEPFEAQLADLARAYADAAAKPGFDAIRAARVAMDSGHAGGWRLRRIGVGRARVGVPWAVILIGIAVLGLLGLGVLANPPVVPTPSPRPSDTGAVPDSLRHAWARPGPIFPGLDKWGSGFLSLGDGQIEFGSVPGSTASRALVEALDSETLRVTSTAATQGCALSASGTYVWSLDGKGTILDLTAAGPDGCPARETALVGPWVRSDFPPVGVGLPAGRYLSSRFDPLADPTSPMRLAYKIPEGWEVIEDSPASLMIHHHRDGTAGRPGTETFVAVLTQPRMAALQEAGTACGPIVDDPAVGTDVDALVAAIRARPGLVVTGPSPISIGGRDGRLLDLRVAPTWTGGCGGPDGPSTGVAILHQTGAVDGPVVGVSVDQPTRLILVDLGGSRTLAIVLFVAGGAGASEFEAGTVVAMPIVDGFEFQPPSP